MKLKDPTTQLTEVLHALLTNETITVNSIMSELKIINLSARISDLRDKHDLYLPCVLVHTSNKWKRKVRYGTWSLRAKVKGLKLYNKLNKKKSK